MWWSADSRGQKVAGDPFEISHSVVMWVKQCHKPPMTGNGSYHLPSGKHTKNYDKSPFLMGKSTISMAMFNSYVSLSEGIYGDDWGMVYGIVLPTM